jgi:hypothetical protein
MRIHTTWARLERVKIRKAASEKALRGTPSVRTHTRSRNVGAPIAYAEQHGNSRFQPAASCAEVGAAKDRSPRRPAVRRATARTSGSAATSARAAGQSQGLLSIGDLASAPGPRAAPGRRIGSTSRCDPRPRACGRTLPRRIAPARSKIGTLDRHCRARPCPGHHWVRCWIKNFLAPWRGCRKGRGEFTHSGDRPAFPLVDERAADGDYRPFARGSGRGSPPSAGRSEVAGDGSSGLPVRGAHIAPVHPHPSGRRGC